MTDVLCIGGRREIFWDDCILEKNEAEFRLAVPEKREIVMVLDKPWEGSVCCYFSAFHDGEQFRMYYRGCHGADDYNDIKSYICMLTSKDGIKWERPQLDILELNGEKTNIVLYGTPDSQEKNRQIDPKNYHPAGESLQFSDNFFAFLDTNPACPREEKFKAISVGPDPAERTPRPGNWGWEYATLWGYISPDGLHWKKMPQSPLINQGGFDSLNTVRWDHLNNEYRLYYRDFHPDPGRPSGVVRDIRTCSSKDFIHWTEGVPLAYGGAPDEELYTNNIIPYYRAPHILVGFPTRYVQREFEPLFEQLPNLARREKCREQNRLREGTAITDGLFMTSRDGVNFRRWDEPFLRPGIARGHNWVYGDGYQSWGLIETPAEDPEGPAEISFFAGEDYRSTSRTVSLRRYTVRLDGFAYLHAGREPKTVITKPLTFEGKTLTLNMSTGAAGFVSVEFLESDGSPIPGFSGKDRYKLFGDDLALKALFWRGKTASNDVSSLAGKPIKIRFTLSEARLYALRFV
jgi:hypothetical protein